MHGLGGGVADQDVYLAELLDGACDELFTVFL
jgi:hypothetical protein